jgi:hypothetical protein
MQAVSVVLLLQALMVAIAGDPLMIRIGRCAELGTNGVAFRFIWSRGGDETIAWDVVDSGPRFAATKYDTFVQIPLHYTFLVALVFGIFCRWRGRRGN